MKHFDQFNSIVSLFYRQSIKLADKPYLWKKLDDQFVPLTEDQKKLAKEVYKKEIKKYKNFDEWQRDVKNAGEFRAETIGTIGINELLAGLPNVNFLNIDVEGLDVEIIKALDLEKYDIEVILFEDNVNRGGSKTIQKKLLNHGYELLFISGGSVCYCKKNF